MADLQLVITLDQMTGGIQVAGPIENAVIAYGMLAAAHDAIHDHNAAKAKNKGLVPVFGTLGNGNGVA